MTTKAKDPLLNFRVLDAPKPIKAPKVEKPQPAPEAQEQPHAHGSSQPPG